MSKKRKKKFSLSFSNSLASISLLISLVSLSFSLNLINIENLDLFNSEKNIINDHSQYTNVTIDTQVNNNIKSNISISKIIQNSCGDFYPYSISLSSHSPSIHNVKVTDLYGNKLFIRDYDYNKTITYANCNNEKTDCCVYSSFRLENNLDLPICLELTADKYLGDNITHMNIVITEYFKNNPDLCLY